MPQLQPIDWTLVGPHDPDANALVNMQQALILLIQQGGIAAAQPHPTAAELAKVASDIGFELKTPVYGGATNKAICLFQTQEHLCRGQSDLKTRTDCAAKASALCGNIDSETADRLNAVLKGLGAFGGGAGGGGDPLPVTYVVEGLVSNADGTAADGFAVRVLVRGANGASMAGQGNTSPDGLYNIAFTATVPPDLWVTASNADGTLAATSAIVEKAPTRVTLNLTLPAPQQSTDWLVKGTIVDARGNPQPGVIVRAFDRDLRSEQPLGADATTDDAGRYSILYVPSQFTSAEFASADLVVRAYASAAAGAPVLAQSDVLFNAPPVGIVHLEASVPGQSIESQYERCSAMVMPLLAGQGANGADLAPDQLDADDQRFIVADTSIDAGLLDSWVRAHQAAVATVLIPDGQVPPDAFGAPSADAAEAVLFFAWFRSGLGADATGVFAASEDDLRDALNRAADAHVVPALSPALVKLAVAAALVLHVAGSLGAAPAGSPPSLGDLLGVAFDGARLQQIASTFVATIGTPADLRAAAQSGSTAAAESSGNTQKFWDSLQAAGVAAADIARTRLVFDLDRVTDGHLPLIAELQRESTSAAGFSDASALARFDRADWLALLARPRDPSQPGGAVIGAPAGQSVEDYATQLDTLVSKAFFTPMVANRIGREGTDGGPFQSTRTDLLTFFGNNPDFRLGGQPLRGYLNDGADTKLRGVGNADALQEQVKAMERLARFTTDFTAIRAMLQNGVRSAADIWRIGPAQFDSTYAGVFGSGDAARRVVDQAGAVVLASYSLYLRFGWQTAGSLPYALATDSGDAVDLSGLGAADRATWRTLFGSADLATCACEDCQSATSPSAYLVDLLNFLGRNANQEQGSPLDVLLQRRPDLANVEFTCDNTNTALPYVDLVNEVLARALARGGMIENNGTFSTAALDAGQIPAMLQTSLALTSAATLRADTPGQHWVLRDPGWRYVLKSYGEGLGATPYAQTTGTDAERAASPQHVDLKARQALAAAGYPWAAPVTLPLMQSRRYLAQLGVRREDLLALGSPTDPAIAIESLGLSALEADIITGAVTADPSNLSGTGAQPWTFWGFDSDTVQVPDPTQSGGAPLSGPWPQVVARVAVLLARSRLDYAALLQLLDTRFVNPPAGTGRQLALRAIAGAPVDSCDPGRLTITGLDAAALGRLHRFVRLQRALDWSARDLDRALAALSPQDISQSTLATLADLQRVATRLRLPVARALALWADIDAWAYAVPDASDAAGQPPRSPYASLFRNTALLNPLDPIFTETPSAIPDAALADHLPAILAGLRIDADAVARILAFAQPQVASPRLTLANLSLLLRHAELAQSLRLSVADLLLAIGLFGGTPFDGTPATTRRFIARIDALRDLGVPIASLAWLLQDADPGGLLAAAETRQLDALLTALRTGLARIVTDNAVTVDADGSVTRGRLALLNWNPDHVQQLVTLLGDSGTTTAPLAAFPQGLVLPDDVATRLRYDSATALLAFDGVMSTATSTALKGLSAGPNVDPAPFRTAVDALHDASRDQARAFLLAHARAFALPEFTAPAAPKRLANAVTLPDAWRGRLRYESSAGALVASGALGDADLSALKTLSSDVDYRAALDSLAAQATSFVPDAGNTFLIDTSVANPSTAADAALARLFDGALSPAQRFADVLGRLGIYLRRVQSEAFVVQALAEALHAETVTIQRLLSQWLASASQGDRALDDLTRLSFARSSGDLDGPGYDDQWTTARRVTRIAALVTRLDLNSDDLALLLQLRPALAAFDLDALPVAAGAPAIPFAQWEAFALGRGLLARVGSSDPDLLGLLLQANAASAHDADKTAWLSAVAARADWDLAALTALAGATAIDNGLLGVAFPAGWRDGTALARLRDWMAMMDRLGLTAAALSALVVPDAAAATADQRWQRLVADSETIRSAAKARFDADAWLDVMKPIEDDVRQALRSGLVAALLARGEDGSDEDELYERFLIDVEMCACMSTTRVRQALSTVQLFVQRCVMNLEKDVTLSVEAAREWSQWRSLYRVWQANWEVLIYPENWLEPTLRDDRTTPFQELQRALLQDDLTDATAQDAVHQYLDRLHQFSRLDVAGLCVQPDPTSTLAGDTCLHVFGRTQALPHVYFHRVRRHTPAAQEATADQRTGRREDYQWGEWEKLDLDIEGDHLVPAVWHGHLYLAWPVITNKSVPVDQRKPVSTGYPGEQWEVKLAWSEWRNGRWLPKRISTDALIKPIDPSPDVPRDTSSFKFLAVTTSAPYPDGLSWDCYGQMLRYPPPHPTAPPPPPVTLPDKLLYSAGKGNWVAMGFTVDGMNPSDSDRQSMAILFRTAAGTTVNGPVKEPITGVAFILISDMNSPPTDYLMRQTIFAVTNVKVGSSWPYTTIDVNLTKIHAAVAVSGTPAPPPPPPTPFVLPTLGSVGRFALDNCTGDVKAIQGATVNQSLLTATPVGQTHFEYMQNVENDTGFQPGPFGVNHQMLRSTPGTYRVLLRPDGYADGSLTLPFVYQDSPHAYLVEMVTSAGGYWGGSQRLSFQLFQHPHTCAFVDALFVGGMDGLMDPALQSLTDYGTNFNLYQPDKFYVDADVAGDPTPRSPREDVDFTSGGAYAVYNWELFFHIPLLIACQLSANQRFDEARRWFHYIFDPTSSAPGGRERFWRFKPFHDEALAAPQSLEEFLRDGSDELSAEMAAWERAPFQPWVIARMRRKALMKTVVIKYIDNLIAWGDQLFQRGTLESTDEATLLYVLAQQILGPRPTMLPARVKPVVQSFDSLHRSGPTDILAAQTEIESFVPPSLATLSGNGAAALSSLGTMALFCIPADDELLKRWDTVERRLFNIRHCLNSEGVRRDIPIWDPPIDPALLVRAAAAGVDLASVLGDLDAPLPLYRFATISQKAGELCNEVKSLGAALLSALEKRDGEQLALLRAGHELAVLRAVRDVKQRQVAEAQATLDGLVAYQDVVTARQVYYAGRPFLNANEILHLTLAGLSLLPMEMQMEMEIMTAVMHLIPDFKIGAPTTVGTTYGGSNIAGGIEGFAHVLGTMSSMMNTTASLSATLGGYARRSDDWAHQANLATLELKQVAKQIVAAGVRLAIAGDDLSNHELQIANSQEASDFMREKFTSADLFDWMAGEVAQVYFQSYRLAWAMARRAERAYGFELGISDSDFIQYGYWDSLKKGLLAGERLQFDLRRLDADYLERNRREFEITRHVSLQSVDPLALIRLRETGQCEFQLPEALFDLDFPGHYHRRIKSVAISVPCVTGPYTGVPCTLTLLRSSVRSDGDPGQGGYARQVPPQDDTRFQDFFGAVQSVATSLGQNDSGLFETNLRDERYLPFEGLGVIDSRWRLEMPQAFRPFDYDTISDVLLHVRYVARDGGAALRKAAVDALTASLQPPAPGDPGPALARLVSLKREYPTLWSQLMSADASAAVSKPLALARNRFPFIYGSANHDLSVQRVDVFAVPDRAQRESGRTFTLPVMRLTPPGGTPATPKPIVAVGAVQAGTLALPVGVDVALAEADAQWQLEVSSDVAGFQRDVADLMLIFHYAVG